MRRLAKLGILLGALLLLPGHAIAEGVDELPKDIQEKLYSKNMLDPSQPIGSSAYRNWKSPRKPPWTIGYASSYAGNTWRAGVMDRLVQKLIGKWQKLGLLKEVLVTQSNLNDALQIQQMRQLVDRGVDALIVCCSNPTALNATVKYAFDKGVPTFSFVGYLTSPYSINSSSNYQLAGHRMGTWMAKELGGKGNVLVVEGIPGTSGSDSQDRGIKAGLAANPGIKVVGSIAGMWTDQVAQAEVQKWLATHPGKLDGIVVQSAAEMGVLRALQQSGRKMIPVTIGGELGAICYWRKNIDYISSAYHVWPPGDDFELIWNIMMRTLQGQGPKLQSVLVDVIPFGKDDVKKMMGTDCDENNKLWAHVGIETWGGKKFLDNFFLRPADPEKYKASMH
ncbi:MAG: ABC transporter substrate-binding protein [Rhodospirillaceae bacterium]|nr:ABC transporter substrate-binding protein [Rhodospirillaceae bacterium]